MSTFMDKIRNHNDSENMLAAPKEWLADDETRLAARRETLQAVADYAAFSAKKRQEKKTN